MDAFEKGMAVLVILLFGVIGVAIYGIAKADSECKDSGGRWEVTGEYQTNTTYIMSGKTLIPMTSTTEISKCVKGGE